jgi:hypothetical protein
MLHNQGWIYTGALVGGWLPAVVLMWAAVYIGLLCLWPAHQLAGSVSHPYAAPRRLRKMCNDQKSSWEFAVAGWC